MEHMGITIDPNRDALFDDLGTMRLKESYMIEEEISPQERFAYVSKTFGSDTDHSQRLYDYVSKHWLSYSTPILSYGRSKRGLPISCYLNFINDTAEGLVENLSETNWLSMLGGGVGIGFGIRSADDKSTGVMPHLKMYDASSLAYRQGRTRRGSYAAYLDISHPDLLLFLEMRKPTGDQNFRCLNLHHGINITDDFMQAVIEDKDWEFVDPNDERVTDKMNARKIWQQILETRFRTGEPYLNFIDTANKHLPAPLKKAGLKINGSNLCNEIHLPTSEDRTAVCCLSSLNLEYYDDWKDTTIVQDLITMLDNVLEHFIDNATGGLCLIPDMKMVEFKEYVKSDKKGFERAAYSAYRERAIGLGAMGFHSYLQRNGIPFEGMYASSFNNRAFKLIKERSQMASRRLARERGEAPDMAGSGYRNSHLLAVAPNASSSIICGGTSPSIEPTRANVFTHKTLTGSFKVKNKYLEKLLEEKGINTEKLWKQIAAADGSVKDIKELSCACS